ncbi:MAG: hypothetical protein AAGL10_04210 [Pseudomonadota bacterium]
MTAIVLGAVPAYAVGTIAAVESGEQRGQAVLFPHQGKCHALTAFHVVKDTVGGTLFLPGPGNRSVRFERIGADEAEDIALLEVLGNRDLTLCSSKFFEAVSVASLLNQDNRAQIQLVDGETIGRIGGTVISNDTSYTTLRMRPYQTNDPLVEKGISGGVMLVGGNPVAIVTQVQNPDTDPVIVAVSIGKVRSLFPAYLPSRRRYKKYDISWMPSEFLSAMETVRRSVQIGLMRRSGQKKLQAMRGLSHNVPGRSPRVGMRLSVIPVTFLAAKRRFARISGKSKS